MRFLHNMTKHRHILLCLLLIMELSVWGVYAQPEEQLRKHNHYMCLKESLDGGYQMAYDKQVWLHYEEPYSVTDTQGLRFRVYDDDHAVVVETDEVGIPTNPNCPCVPIEYGDNWLEVDLSAVTEYGRYYTMEVWNGKGEKQYLRFKCSSSRPSQEPYEQGLRSRPSFPSDPTYSDTGVVRETILGVLTWTGGRG